MKTISLSKIIEELDLNMLYGAKNLDEIKISGTGINRPGLQLAGNLEKFPYDRIQILGNAEWYYLNSLDKEIRIERIEKIFKKEIPAFIVTRNLPIWDETLVLAKKYNRTLLLSEDITTEFICKLINYLENELAPITTIHGVFLEVYGIGVLLVGESGIGKSEIALELIERGHKFISDDIVEVKRFDKDLRGKALKHMKSFMEIRGVGIINIERLFGVASIKESEYIDLIIELEDWDNNREYDRFSLDDNYIELLGVRITKLTIPVRIGRNIALIVEIAARNEKQKKLGYNASIALSEEVDKEIIRRKENKK